MNDNLDSQDTLCRLCSQKSTIYFSLFDNKAFEMLESLTAIKVDQHENVFSSLCPRCLMELRQAYTIQQRLMHSEKLLLLKLNELTEKIKKEHSLNDIDETLMINATVENTNLSPQQPPNNPNVSIERNVAFSSLPAPPSKLNVSQNPDLNIIDVEYKCDKCPETFSNTSDFLTHLDLHRTKLCCYCGKHIHVDELKEHRKQHLSGECEICGRILANKQALLMHVLYHHAQPKAVCELCGVVSANGKAHEVHMRKMHTKEPSHVCDTCGLKFFGIRGLQQHVTIKHERKLPFVCGVCKKRYPSRKKLEFHERKHSDEKLFVCEFCGKGFNFVNNLKVHQRSVHECVEEVIFKCEECEKGFSTMRALEIHSRMHRK